MPQNIVEIHEVVPSDLRVRLEEGGKVYRLPGDIAVPDFLAISNLTDELQEGSGDDMAGILQDLYEKVLEIFRVHQPEVKDLPIGPRRLGALVVTLYAGAAEEDAKPTRPTRPRAGTRSTSKSRSKRSRSSRS